MATNLVSLLTSVVLTALIAFLLQVLFFSPITPHTLELSPAAKELTKWNDALQKVEKLGEGMLLGPEDVCIDPEDGALYTATRDGWIKKMHRNGTWEYWNMIASDSLLGIKISKTSPGHIVVIDAQHGVLKISKNTVTIVAAHCQGSKIPFADDGIEASDGNIYFSDASTKFDYHHWYLDVLEAIPHGRLLMYDASTKQTSVLLDNLAFGNGVTLSKDEDYVVICETWKFRCVKYFLKGDKKGKTEFLVENLPGGPDNIKLAPDGTFWIALLEIRVNGYNFLHKSKLAKHFVAAFPSIIEFFKTRGIYSRAMVVNVDSSGKILRKFDDSTGKVLHFVTSVLEFEGHLYLGSLHGNFIGKLPLE
ncbi:hypothetical protein IFM89_028558 [Coptis chinensis]|uniref:Strictosidine synthase conserved region domain-containing protein n=1 Tax=Coptis chinensis TaxID=261450 RepID=A0A835IGN4_9MAGN|nr:hypothetical protein IFM89_028558 [Coptis chinensis]